MQSYALKLTNYYTDYVAYERLPEGDNAALLFIIKLFTF